MPLNPTVQKELAKQEPSDFHNRLKEHVRTRMKMSAERMVKYHPIWDKHADTVAGYRQVDQADRRAQKLKEPDKMVVPLGRAQVHTFVAFQFLYNMQRQYYFEYSPQDAQDFKIRDTSEKLVHRDCHASRWPILLYQFLLDAARFNVGVLEHTWEKRVKHFPQTVLSSSTIAGIDFQSERATMTPITTFEGNRLFNISPYTFYPDPRVELTNIHRGEFCGVEQEMTREELKQLEAQGDVAGVEHIQDFTTASYKQNFRNQKRHIHIQEPRGNKSNSRHRRNDMVSVHRQYVRIVPKEFKIDGKPLGDEGYPVTWLVWLANDHRVIRAEAANHLHEDFPIQVGQYDCDVHNYIGPGLSGIVDKLQSAISWFINSHIISVRRNLDHHFLYDPDFLDANQLQRRGPMIPLRKTVGRKRIQDMIMQLQMGDITAGHMADASQLMEITNLVTGINEAAMGAVHGGRRSATEHRASNQGASARLRTTGATMFDQALGPLAQNLLMTSRQGISREAFDRSIGLPDPNDLQALIHHEEQWQLYKADPAHLAAGADYFTLDPTNPTEKLFMAQALGELFKVVMSVPEAAQAFDIDPGSLFKEIMQLRGAGNVNRHSLRARLLREGNQTQPAVIPTNEPRREGTGTAA